MERNVLPFGPGETHATSLQLRSHTRPLTVTGLKVVADPGLLVEYVGYTRCRPLCVGMALVDSDEERSELEKSIAGRLPFEVPAQLSGGEDFRLVFTARLDAGGAQVLATRCLKVNYVELEVNGRTLIARGAGDNFVFGAEKRDVETPSAKCEG